MTLHRTLPWFALSSGTLAVLGFVGALPAASAWVFKPLTTLLILLWAWPRGVQVPRQRRWILTGLVLSGVGDVCLLWPDTGFLLGLVAFLLAHLAYIAAYCVPLRLAARPAWFVAYGAVALAMLSWLWPGIAPGLRVPVILYVACLATMAAQAAGWWRAASHRDALEAKLARMAALGGLLFMLSDSLLAANKFATPLPWASLWVLSTYWVAQVCIGASLRR